MLFDDDKIALKFQIIQDRPVRGTNFDIVNIREIAGITQTRIILGCRVLRIAGHEYTVFGAYTVGRADRTIQNQRLGFFGRIFELGSLTELDFHIVQTVCRLCRSCGECNLALAVINRKLAACKRSPTHLDRDRLSVIQLLDIQLVNLSLAIPGKLVVSPRRQQIDLLIGRTAACGLHTVTGGRCISIIGHVLNARSVIH